MNAPRTAQENLSLTDLRILLWDIDGTLLRSNKASTFVEYTRPVLEAVFGTAGRIDELPLTGMTDLQFIAEALSTEGFTRAQITDSLHETSNRYFYEIQRAARNGAEFHVLPGVRKALEALSSHTRYQCAVVTGNFRTTADFKLHLADLSNYFALPGAFGDESFDRLDLPQLAAQRISSHLGIELRPSQFIVIGDTPDDVAAAHHFGARSVAVDTGHCNGVDDLLASEPDAVLPDLSDMHSFMRTLEEL